MSKMDVSGVDDTLNTSSYKLMWRHCAALGGGITLHRVAELIATSIYIDPSEEYLQIKLLFSV